MAGPHETKAVQSFSSRFITSRPPVRLRAATLGDVLKCADNQNSLWFIFSPLGSSVYMNVKCEMDLTLLRSLPGLPATGGVPIVSFQSSSRTVFSVCVCAKLYVHCGHWLQLFSKSRGIYPDHFNGLASKKINFLLN